MIPKIRGSFRSEWSSPRILFSNARVAVNLWSTCLCSGAEEYGAAEAVRIDVGFDDAR